MDQDDQNTAMAFRTARVFLKRHIRDIGQDEAISGTLSGFSRALRDLMPLEQVKELFRSYAASLPETNEPVSVTVPDAQFRSSQRMWSAYKGAIALVRKNVSAVGVEHTGTAMIAGFSNELRNHLSDGQVRQLLLGMADTMDQAALYDARNTPN